MAKLTEQELKGRLKKGEYSRIYLLYGEEKMLVSSYNKKLQEKIMGKNPPEFNFHIFNEESTVEEIIQALEIIPFTTPFNYVVINDFPVEKISESDLKILYSNFSDLPETTIVVISMNTLLPTGKKPNVWKKLVDIVDKNGVVIDFAKKTSADLRKQLISWASKRGVLLSPNNAYKIIEYAGTDLNTLKNELDKVCAYVDDGGEITENDIEFLVTKNLATRVFDMTDAVTAGNWEQAFQKLDLLFYQREEPIMILAELSNTYTDMYRVRIAIESGLRGEDVAQSFDYKRKEFRLKKAERASKRLTTEDITTCLNYLAEANTAMNSSSGNKRLLLEQLVAKLIMTGGSVSR